MKELEARINILEEHDMNTITRLAKLENRILGLEIAEDGDEHKAITKKMIVKISEACKECGQELPDNVQPKREHCCKNWEAWVDDGVVEWQDGTDVWEMVEMGIEIDYCPFCGKEL